MLSLAAAEEKTRTAMQTLPADIKVELWFFSLIEKKMSLVTPDLKQEQDGLSSLVDAVGGQGRAGRSPQGAAGTGRGSVPSGR